MVFAILNLGELKFYLSGRKIMQKFYPLSLFFKNKNMFFKEVTCALWNVFQILKNKKVKIKILI